ncbi:MAG TPA: bifunctional UDP-sugar hydrolase/5'-nucleotidase [bacterium]|nr:bifunctional UDP-sugar hydrolase/5'-nucleotidase [bacterium]
MKTKTHSFAFFLGLSCLLFSSFLCAAAQARPSHFTLLFTNDQLGQMEPLASPGGDGKPVGGVSRRMALIEKIRAEVGAANVFLVDGGNLFTGTALSDLTRGEVDCAAYKLMGYDAVVLGEHDFDEGEKALLGFEKDYKIHWISANAVAGGHNFMDSYVLRRVPGLRIGIIGFSNEKTPQLTKRDNVRGLTFYPPSDVAKGLHSILKKDADFFIAVTHEGLAADRKLAKENPFLHVIVGGYSQDALADPEVNKRKDGTLDGPMIVQAGSHGLYLGRLDLTVDGDKKHGYAIQSYQYQLIPITQDLPEDPQMQALLAKFEKKLQALSLDEVLTTVDAPAANNQSGDSLLGEVTADAVRKASGAQVALIHSGAFTADLKPGPFSRESLYALFPSEDDVVTFQMSGRVLRKILEQSAAGPGGAAFLQVSGLTLTRSASGLQISVGGEPLNDHARYKVATNGFLAEGGAGYDEFRLLKDREKTGLMVRSLLEAALKAQPHLSPDHMEKRWNPL